MVGKKTLKEYNSKDIYYYFQMIMESKVNGNLSQAISQIKKLGTKQRGRFIQYCLDVNYDKKSIRFFLANLF
jgi:hypothetical protein